MKNEEKEESEGERGEESTAGQRITDALHIKSSAMVHLDLTLLLY